MFLFSVFSASCPGRVEVRCPENRENVVVVRGRRSVRAGNIAGGQRSASRRVRSPSRGAMKPLLLGRYLVADEVLQRGGGVRRGSGLCGGCRNDVRGGGRRRRDLLRRLSSRRRVRRPVPQVGTSCGEGP